MSNKTNEELNEEILGNLKEEQKVESKVENKVAFKNTLEEWISNNKNKLIYKNHKELWDKYVENNLDITVYDQLGKTLESETKDSNKDFAVDIRNKLTGYLNKTTDIFKQSLPEGYTKNNYKEQFPNPDRSEFIKYLVHLIININEEHLKYQTPLKIMAKFGIDRETLKEWINDKELISSAEDTHSPKTAKELWVIYKIRFDAALAAKQFDKAIESQKMVSLATDTDLGVNIFSEDKTFEDEYSELDFEAMEVTAKESKELDWSEIEEKENE